MRLPTIDAMVGSGAVPRWNGQGYIEIEASEHTRFAFWHPNLGPDGSVPDLRDTSQSLTTTILLGSLLQETWTARTDDTWETGEPFDATHEMLTLDGGGRIVNRWPCEVRRICRCELPERSRYTLAASSFQRIIATRAAAFISLGASEKRFCRAIRPLGYREAEPVGAGLSEEQCWDLIEDLLSTA